MATKAGQQRPRQSVPGIHELTRPWTPGRRSGRRRVRALRTRPLRRLEERPQRDEAPPDRHAKQAEARPAPLRFMPDCGPQTLYRLAPQRRQGWHDEGRGQGQAQTETPCQGTTHRRMPRNGPQRKEQWMHEPRLPMERPGHPGIYRPCADRHHQQRSGRQQIDPAASSRSWGGDPLNIGGSHVAVPHVPRHQGAAAHDYTPGILADQRRVPRAFPCNAPMSPRRRPSSRRPPQAAGAGASPGDQPADTVQSSAANVRAHGSRTMSAGAQPSAARSGGEDRTAIGSRFRKP